MSVITEQVKYALQPCLSFSVITSKYFVNNRFDTYLVHLKNLYYHKTVYNYLVHLTIATVKKENKMYMA